jgi:hypothetical protein
MNNQTKKQECCPKFNPEPWDNKELNWQDKKFIKGKVFTLFFMPMNFGSVITRLIKTTEKAGVQTPEMMCLSDHTSKWNMDIYLAVNKEIPGEQNVSLSGRFLSKVYEGNFKETGKWCQDFESYVKSQNLEIKKMYMWYTTCPKCAKKYGKNYIVIISEVK